MTAPWNRLLTKFFVWRVAEIVLYLWELNHLLDYNKFSETLQKLKNSASFSRHQFFITIVISAKSSQYFFCSFSSLASPTTTQCPFKHCNLKLSKAIVGKLQAAWSLGKQQLCFAPNSILAFQPFLR